MKKLHLGYPDQGEESEMLERVVGQHPIESLEPVTTIETLRGAREAVAEITVKEPIREYATRLAEYTRGHAKLGVSPRGTLALLRASQARAAISGREYVVPDDVQQEAVAVMSHRVRLAESGKTSGVDVVTNALERVRVE